MKKHILSLLLLAALSVLADTWRIRFDKALTPEDARKVSIGELSTADWKSFDFTGYRMDLDTVAGKTMAVKDAAVMSCTFTSDSDTVWAAGAACDWWLEVFINGQSVFSTMKNGNVGSDYTPAEHLFQLPVKKGANTIAIYAVRGDTSWMTAFARIADKRLLPKDKDALRNFLGAISMDAQAVAIDISAPWIPRLSSTSATVGIEFSKPVPAAIRFTAPGVPAVTQWTTVNGLKRMQAIHRFELADLKPGTTYDYAVIYLDMTVPKEIEAASGTFTTLPSTGSSHVFYAVSDNQISQKQRMENFNAMFRNCGMGSADFIASLGDMDSSFHDFRRVYFTSFLDVLAANGYGRRAQIVRGNHEYRGNETDLFHDCFGTGYYTFSCGDVFYIVLDTFEDQPVHTTEAQHWSLRDDLSPHVEQQARWFADVIASDACKNAKKRIILAHTVPFEFENQFYYRNISRVVAKHIFGPNPVCPIDLWLCADIHSPYRFDPVAKQFIGAKRWLGKSRTALFKAFDRSQITFPVYVNDGPKGAGIDISVTKVTVTEDGIRLTQMAPDGTVKDDVTFRKGQPAQVHSTTFVNYDEAN